MNEDPLFIKKQIEILEGCREGLITSLTLEKSNEPLFYVDNNMRLILPNDANSHIRISYLAFLKICFEKSSSNDSILRKFKEEIVRDDVQLNVYPIELIDPKYSQYYEDRIFKKILLEFFIMLKISKRSVIDYVSRYPILDTILIIAFKTLLWHRKPTRLIETQILSIDSLVAFFKETLDIRLVYQNGQIVFEDFGMHIGFEGSFLYLYDEDSRRFTFTEQSRVKQFNDSFNEIWNSSGDQEIYRTPQRKEVEKVLKNSWVIPQESIYQRLDSEDYTFTEGVSDSRQNTAMKNLIHSFKRTLGTTSLNQSKQNNIRNPNPLSERAQQSRHKAFHDKSNQSFSYSYGKRSLVKMTESFEEVLGYNVDKIRIEND